MKFDAYGPKCDIVIGDINFLIYTPSVKLYYSVNFNVSQRLAALFSFGLLGVCCNSVLPVINAVSSWFIKNEAAETTMDDVTSCVTYAAAILHGSRYNKQIKIS